MSWPIMLVYAGLVTASVAAATYGVWAVRWARRKAWLLAVLNGLIALAGVALIFDHLLNLSDPLFTELRLRRVPRGLLFIDVVFLLPAITRLLELKRDKRRDAVRQVIERGIQAQREANRADEDSPPTDE